MVMAVLAPPSVRVASVEPMVMVRVLPSRTAVMVLPSLPTSAPMASNTARKGRKVRPSCATGTASVKVRASPLSWTAMPEGAGEMSMVSSSAARAEPQALSTVRERASASARLDMDFMVNSSTSILSIDLIIIRGCARYKSEKS